MKFLIVIFFLFLITLTPTFSNEIISLEQITNPIKQTGFLELKIIKSDVYIKLMVFSVLFFFALYHLALFLAWMKDKTLLLFSLLSFVFSIITITTDEIILIQFYSDLSLELIFRILYTSGYIVLPLFVVYMGSLYPKHSLKMVEYIYIFIGFIFVCISLFTPIEFFTITLVAFELIVITLFVYNLWILFKSYIAKEKASILVIGVFIAFSIIVLHDLLMAKIILIPYGFIFYILSQAIILFSKYTGDSKNTEVDTNYLELLVENRTSKLLTLVKRKELLLKELNHRVKNNFQLILGLLRIQKKDANEETKTNFKNFEMQIKVIASIHETLSFQNNMEKIDLNIYISEILISFKQLYPKLDFIFENNKQIYIDSNYAIYLGLIFNELITNCLKYSKLNNTKFLIDTYEKNSIIIIKYEDGTNFASFYEKIEEETFGLPKLGWAMIKGFLNQIDASIEFSSTFLEIRFVNKENK